MAVASKGADTSGDWLVHGDLGPGNWCRTTGGGWKFVDWASAYRGNPNIDPIIAAIRFTRLTGDLCHTERLAGLGELVAFISGRFAGELLDVDWSASPIDARAGRIADIRAALRLTACRLELAEPVFTHTV